MPLEYWDLLPHRLELKPAYKVSSSSDTIQITVAIPAYKRDIALIRCLESLAHQRSRPFIVIISNDDPNGDVISSICEQFRDKFHSLEFYQQHANLGSLGNFNFLLQKSKTEYFMWLANDDAISETWLEDLALLLDANPTAAGAMGKLVVARRDGTSGVSPQLHNASKIRPLRLWKYIWHSDDAFFYSLYRREALRAGRFPGYFRPNKGYIKNWCYVYLVGPLSYGPIIYADSCSLWKYEDEIRHYPDSPPTGSKSYRLLTHTLRRLNVHYLYFIELRRFGVFLAVVGLLVSLAAILRDIIDFSARVAWRYLEVCRGRLRAYIV